MFATQISEKRSSSFEWTYVPRFLFCSLPPSQYLARESVCVDTDYQTLGSELEKNYIFFLLMYRNENLNTANAQYFVLFGTLLNKLWTHHLCGFSFKQHETANLSAMENVFLKLPLLK